MTPGGTYDWRSVEMQRWLLLYVLIDRQSRLSTSRSPRTIMDELGPNAGDRLSRWASNCRSGYYIVTVRTLATDRLEGSAERESGPQGRLTLGRAKTWKVPIERMLSPGGHRGRNC